jgi:hypothetical protein
MPSISALFPATCQTPEITCATYLENSAGAPPRQGGVRQRRQPKLYDREELRQDA